MAGVERRDAGVTARAARLAHPVELYEAALAGLPVVATSAFGTRALDVDRWDGPPDPVDHLLLSRCRPPVLDLGCGPGRLVAELSARGVPALGVDVSAGAVARARSRGAPVLCRDLAEELPGEGRWGTVLLADGNIGIGGEPGRLLSRCRRLLAPGGLLLVEADEDPHADHAMRIELRCGDGRRSRPMPWATAGEVTLARLAPGCGLVPVETWRVTGRTIVCLQAPWAAGPTAPDVAVAADRPSGVAVPAGAP